MAIQFDRHTEGWTPMPEQPVQPSDHESAMPLDVRRFFAGMEALQRYFERQADSHRESQRHLSAIGEHPNVDDIGGLVAGVATREAAALNELVSTAARLGAETWQRVEAATVAAWRHDPANLDEIMATLGRVQDALAAREPLQPGAKNDTMGMVEGSPDDMVNLHSPPSKQLRAKIKAKRDKYLDSAVLAIGLDVYVKYKDAGKLGETWNGLQIEEKFGVQNGTVSTWVATNILDDLAPKHKYSQIPCWQAEWAVNVHNHRDPDGRKEYVLGGKGKRNVARIRYLKERVMSKAA